MKPYTLNKIKVLTKYLNKQAGNPSDWTFKIDVGGLPEVYYKVDLNGNGQCIEDFIVLEMDEIPCNMCLPWGYNPYKDKSLFKTYKKVKYFIVREADLPLSDI